eukprot:TRINITY_DN115202_c0_g1_i1.p1 TRINITY_DN115202_c0_g1~~TRINITY_DN115202_c0_g1_i1.p1  ORF type:complete len:759 (-),score=145.42 TRINITY_DN115202_c0_g1_i1:71-2326(-)
MDNVATASVGNPRAASAGRLQRHDADIDPEQFAWLPAIRPLTGAGSSRSGLWEEVTRSSTSMSFRLSEREALEDDPLFITDLRTRSAASRPDSAFGSISNYSGGGASYRSAPAGFVLSSSASDSALSLARHLHGVSSKAMGANARSQLKLGKLATMGQEELGMSRGGLGKQRRASNFRKEIGVLSEEASMERFDKLAGAITTMKGGLDTFDPRRSGTVKVPFSAIYSGGKVGAVEGKGNSKEDDDAQREFKEKQRERLLAYKFSRKFETELPPLAPIESEAPPRDLPPQDRIAKNASIEAVHCWLPHNRQEVLDIQKEEHEHRMAMCTTTRERQIQVLAKHYTKDLERKRKQGEAAMAARKVRPSAAASSSGESEFAADQWLTILAMVQFLEQLSQDHKIRQVPNEEREAYLESQKAQGNVFVKNSKATRTLMLQSSPTLARCILMLSAMTKFRKKRYQIRINAKQVYLAMQSWSVSGRIIINLKHIAHQARLLQAWWRRCSERLKEIRESISLRWERFERAHLSVECSKWERPKGGKQVEVLPLEDRVAMETISKANRLRFIENELRTRRYNLLPAIALWEKECKEWSKEYERQQLEKDAYEALGATYGGHLFTFPPTRPSHLPPAHPPGEVTMGTVCTIHCIGRKGDEEIFGWYQRCRQDPLSWTRILKLGDEKKGKKTIEEDQEEEPEQEQSEAPVSIEDLLEPSHKQAIVFQKAGEEDLKRFGVVATALPGGEAPSEGKNIPIAYPC